MRKLTGHLYFWVLTAIVTGGIIGYCNPTLGIQLKPLGDGFIAAVKMLIAPVIFTSVVVGIAGMADLKKVGRVGAKALLYFELVSSVALLIGMIVVNVLRPGAGFHASAKALDAAAVADYARQASGHPTQSLLLHLIPNTFVDAFTGSGDLIQVLLIALLFGFALGRMGEKGRPVLVGIDALSGVFFGMVALVMQVAPIGALGAMAFTVGKYGLAALTPLLKLLGSFYLAAALFVLLVLGTIAACTGFSILRFISYFRTELLTVLGTSSSESVLVSVMEKLERLGCSKSVVGLVVPAGYSFNLDGTNIYLTMASLFVAQALDIDLSMRDQFWLLGMAMLTSKGASGVTGAGFITLAATLAVVPVVPVAGLSLILGVDRFMSECRALTNVIGNGVAAIVISRWEGELDMERLRNELAK